MATDVQGQTDAIIAKDLLIAAIEKSSGGIALYSDPVKAAQQLAEAYALLLAAVRKA